VAISILIQQDEITYRAQDRLVGEFIGVIEIYYRIYPIDRYKKALTEVRA